MADISRELQDILDAVYGEEVRDSIHDAIALINDVGEVALTLGTDVTSESSSIEGYYDGSVYINTTTYIMWVCDGTAWVNKGSLKGADGANGADGASLTATSEKVGKITTVTISNAVTGAVVNTFTVSDGKDGTGGGGGVSDWADLENKPFESVGTGLKTDGGVLALSSEVSAQIVNLDSNGKISASNVLDTDGTTAISQKLSKLDSDGKIAYSDVKNTPTIPSKTSDLTNDSGYLVASDIVGKADKTLISDAYSSSKTYSVGEYCIDNNKIWKKIGASEVGVTPTEGSSWTECSAGKELSDINTNLISILGDKLFNFKTNETGYKDMTQEGTTVSNVVGTVYIPKGKYLIISSAYFPYNSTNFSRRIVKLSVGQTDASKNITLCDWSCARAMWANSPMFSSILNNEIDRTYYVLAVNQWLSGDRITLPVQILGLYLGEPD